MRALRPDRKTPSAYTILALSLSEREKLQGLRLRNFNQLDIECQIFSG